MNDSDAPLLTSRPDPAGTLCRLAWVISIGRPLCNAQATVAVNGTAFCTDHGSIVLAGGIEEALERSEG